MAPAYPKHYYSGDPHDAPDHYTFSQRYGYDPLPDPMNPGQMSRGLRRRLCDCVHYFLRESTESSSRYLTLGSATVVRNTLGRFNGTPARQVPPVVDFALESFEECTMASRSDQVLTLLEFLLNEMAQVDRERAAKLAVDFRRALEIEHAPYVLDEKRMSFRFIPCASGEQAAAVRRALESLHGGGYLGAAQHLRNAADSGGPNHIHDRAGAARGGGKRVHEFAYIRASR